MAPCIARLQPGGQQPGGTGQLNIAPSTVTTLDAFAEELLKCCQNLSVHQVCLVAVQTLLTTITMYLLQIWSFLRTDVLYEKQNAMAIRLEKVPCLSSASIHFVTKLTKDINYGLYGRKDFLESLPDKDQVIDKVNKNNHRYKCGINQRLIGNKGSWWEAKKMHLLSF